MMPQLPYGLAQHIYGADALQFKPQRWMTPADCSTAAAAATTVAGDGADAATGPSSKSGMPPEPLTFMTGQRDW
jgi:hypothetical protein